MCTFVSFRCIHFICSYYFDKHPSLCKQFSWYQSPDKGYWNQNAAELTVPFEENFDWAHQRKLEKYEDLREQYIRNGWITNVFTRISIYMYIHTYLNIYIYIYIYIYSHLSSFKLKTLCARLYLFVVYILFAPIISTSIHRCVNNSPDIKVLMNVIETKTFNVDFTSQ